MAKVLKPQAAATAYRSRTRGFLFKITFQDIITWLNYDSVTEEIQDRLAEGLEDALGKRSSGSVNLTVTLSAVPEIETRGNSKYLNMSNVKVNDYTFNE